MRNKYNNILIIVVLLFAVLFFFANIFSAHAQSPNANDGAVKSDPLLMQGIAIAREAIHRDSGFGDFTADLTMVLRNSHGEETTRTIRNMVLENEISGDKTIMVFENPKPIKGTALLTFSHKTKNDDQWLYLPALKRVKRISSNNKSGPFMGSEFAYEDLSSDVLEKYTYKYLGEELLDAAQCYVVERYPATENSGYSRQVVWYDKAEYRTKKIEYYNLRNDHLKTLVYGDYEQFLGKYWKAGEMVMTNHLTGKITISTWYNFKFGTGLSDSDFNKDLLHRLKN